MWKNPIEKWTTEFLGATIIGVVLWVVPMTWEIRCFGVLFLWLLIADLIRRTSWSRTTKFIFVTASAFVLAFLVYPQIRMDYETAQPPAVVSVAPLPAKLSVTPGVTTNASDAFSTRFILQNNDSSPILDWSFVCQVMPSEETQTQPSNDGDAFADADEDQYPMLNAGASFSLHCQFPPLDGSALNHANLVITIFYYEPNNPIKFDYSAVFFLERDQSSGQAAEWLPANAGISLQDAEKYILRAPVP